MQSNRESLPKLQALKIELDAWRTQQQGRKKIPQYFWDQAYDLLNHHSIGTLSRELRLDYQKLKKHTNSSNIAHNSNTTPQFLELAASKLAETAQGTLHCDQHSEPKILPQATTSCRMLIERVDGNRLTLHLPIDWSKIEAICNNFLRG